MPLRNLHACYCLCNGFIVDSRTGLVSTHLTVVNIGMHLVFTSENVLYFVFEFLEKDHLYTVLYEMLT